jgi:hypothetical protein
MTTAQLTRPDLPKAAAPRDALVMLGGAAALVLLGFLPHPLRIVDLPFVLLLPGYALATACLGPGRPTSMPVRVALWIALSLASLAVVGMAIGAIGLELPKWRIIVGQVLVVVCAAAATVIRPPEEDLVDPTGPDGPELSIGAGGPVPRRSINRTPVVLGLLAALVLGLVTVAVVHHQQDPKDEAHFLELRFADPTPARRLSYPGKDPVSVHVVVENHGLHTRKLTVAAGIDGADAWKPKVIVVGPGRTWTGTLSGAVPKSGCLQRLAVALVDGDKGTPVGRLTQWVDGAPHVQCG